MGIHEDPDGIIVQARDVGGAVQDAQASLDGDVRVETRSAVDLLALVVVELRKVVFLLENLTGTHVADEEVS